MRTPAQVRKLETEVSATTQDGMKMVEYMQTQGFEYRWARNFSRTQPVRGSHVAGQEFNLFFDNTHPIKVSGDNVMKLSQRETT